MHCYLAQGLLLRQHQLLTTGLSHAVPAHAAAAGLQQLVQDLQQQLTAARQHFLTGIGEAQLARRAMQQARTGPGGEGVSLEMGDVGDGRKITSEKTSDSLCGGY